MKTTNTIALNPEPLDADHSHQLICWKSVFGGLLISVMAYMILTALGAAIGGTAASNLVTNEEGGAGLATGVGIWLGVSAVVSLFLGGYFSLRISNFVTNKIGAAHGFLVASLFFILMIWGTANLFGGLFSGLGKMAGALGTGAASIVTNPIVQDTVQKSLGNSSLKSDPKEVAQGLAMRLLQGDIESARNYYSYQTGLSQFEVDSKVAQLKADLDQTAKRVGEKTANGVADSGWSLFVTFIIGLFGAVIGGRIGAHANSDRPIARYEGHEYGRPVTAHV